MDRDPFYAFEIALHARPSTSGAGGRHVDVWGEWPTLDVPPAVLAQPLSIGFDDAFARLAGLERMFVEPDGSFVWVGTHETRAWQIDGQALERDGRVLQIELRGLGPRTAFDRLLAAFGWPEQPLVMLLVRPAVLLDEAVFRRHAENRGSRGDAAGLRPA
jgi:hypothetical protein